MQLRTTHAGVGTAASGGRKALICSTAIAAVFLAVAGLERLVAGPPAVGAPAGAVQPAASLPPAPPARAAPAAAMAAPPAIAATPPLRMLATAPDPADLQRAARDKLAAAMPPPSRRAPAGSSAGNGTDRTEPPLLSDPAHIIKKFAGFMPHGGPPGRAPVEVPAVFAERFPAELAALKSVEQRKQLFIQTVLPLVLRSNRTIMEDRRRLLHLAQAQRAGRPLAATDRDFLSRLARRYGVEDGDLAELSRRVDIVPPSLALAQGAEESGWGTSRFARNGNAVFGQRTFSPGDGMVPQDRADGETFEVRSFAALEASVQAYMRNLNSHPAYAEFRAVRADMRARGRRLDSQHLAGTLLRYSERGAAYVETLQAILRDNRLQRFDDARLVGRNAASGARPALPDNT